MIHSDYIQSLANISHPSATGAHSHRFQYVQAYRSPMTSSAPQADRVLFQWNKLHRQAWHYANATGNDREHAFNALYDAAIAYVQTVHPDHPRLADPGAPTQDDVQLRQAALDSAVQGALAQRTGGRPPPPPSGNDLPSLVTAILDMRPHRPPPVAPVTLADIPVVNRHPAANASNVPNVPSMPSAPANQSHRGEPVAPQHDAPPYKLLQLLDNIRNPPWWRRSLGADTDQRLGAVSDLKKYLGKTSVNGKGYIERRPERDHALAELCKILVSDPPPPNANGPRQRAPLLDLNFKDVFFERHMMRLLARYLSPDTAIRLPKLKLPSYVQNLLRQGGSPQHLVSEKARMAILPPLLRASHCLHPSAASTLLSMAFDNLLDDKKIGGLENRLTMLDAFVDAFLNNAGSPWGGRVFLDDGECERVADFAATITSSLSALTAEASPNTCAPLLDCLGFTLERLRQYRMNNGADEHVDYACQRLADAVQNINHVLARLDPAPDYVGVSTGNVPPVDHQAEVALIAEQELAQDIPPNSEAPPPTYDHATRASLAEFLTLATAHDTFLV